MLQTFVVDNDANGSICSSTDESPWKPEWLTRVLKT